MSTKSRDEAIGSRLSRVVVEHDERDPMPLDAFIAAKGCSRSQVYRRLDIPKVKIKGRIYIPRAALAVTIRGTTTNAGFDGARQEADARSRDGAAAAMRQKPRGSVFGGDE